MRYMKPAWSITFFLEGFDAEEMLTSWKWQGSASSERFALSASVTGDPSSAMGRVTVRSWQPYKAAAIADARRAALDLCAVIGAATGGLSTRLVFPPASVDALEGAKSLGGIGLTDSVSFGLTQQLDSKVPWLIAVDKLADDPTLRADLDTFAVAKRELDQAARVLNLYRIYDRFTRGLLETVSPLLDDGKLREKILKAVVAELPEHLDSVARSRVHQTISNALLRVRSKSRSEVIHSAVVAMKGCETFSKTLLERIDSRRGRIAHNPTVLEEAVADQEADSALFSIVSAQIKERLGI